MPRILTDALGPKNFAQRPSAAVRDRVPARARQCPPSVRLSLATARGAIRHGAASCRAGALPLQRSVAALDKNDATDSLYPASRRRHLSPWRRRCVPVGEPATRARSSIGQSIGLRNRRLQVRVLSGVFLSLRTLPVLEAPGIDSVFGDSWFRAAVSSPNCDSLRIQAQDLPCMIVPPIL